MDGSKKLLELHEFFFDNIFLFSAHEVSTQNLLPFGEWFQVVFKAVCDHHPIQP